VNLYRFTFQRVCPADGATVDYTLELITTGMVLVEEIRKACTGGPVFQEALADELRDVFGGVQRIVAVHQGVQVETLRP